MIDWLGIDHLLDLSGTEALAGFLTPLAVFAVFFLAQIILPARRVPGYVVNPDTGEPRNYRLNGLLVFGIAVVVWAFELTGMPRDWFYRSAIYAVAGGTVFCLLFSLFAVFSQPQGEIKNSFLALWEGRALELPFFNERFDVKMYLYVVGGTMLVLNALSGAAYHYQLFGDDSNPGVFLYTAFFTFYIFDYMVFERVQLYTYDLIHEMLGFKLIWGGLIIYGWLYILPLWGMAVHPDPGFSTAWTLPLADRGHGPVSVWLEFFPRREPAEVLVQTLAGEKVPGHHRARVHPGRRPQDPVQRILGPRSPFQLPGRGNHLHFDRPGVRAFCQPLGLDLPGIHSVSVHLASAPGR